MTDVVIRYDDAAALSGKKLFISYNSDNTTIEMTDRIYEEARIQDEAGVNGNDGPFEAYGERTGVVYLTSPWENLLLRATAVLPSEILDGIADWGDGHREMLLIREVGSDTGGGSV